MRKTFSFVKSHTIFEWVVYMESPKIERRDLSLELVSIFKSFGTWIQNRRKELVSF
jgi:hypothetical protein